MSESTVEKVGATETVSNEKAQNTFSTAMIISGIRCAFTYVIFPILAPVLNLLETPMVAPLSLAKNLPAFTSSLKS